MPTETSDSLKRVFRALWRFRWDPGEHCTRIDEYRWNRIPHTPLMWRETFIGRWQRRRWITNYLKIGGR